MNHRSHGSAENFLSLSFSVFKTENSSVLTKRTVYFFYSISPNARQYSLQHVEELETENINNEEKEIRETRRRILDRGKNEKLI